MDSFTLSGSGDQVLAFDFHKTVLREFTRVAKTSHPGGLVCLGSLKT